VRIVAAAPGAHWLGPWVGRSVRAAARPSRYHRQARGVIAASAPAGPSPSHARANKVTDRSKSRSVSVTPTAPGTWCQVTIVSTRAATIRPAPAAAAPVRASAAKRARSPVMIRAVAGA
jgi:hypothetical protein